MDRPMVAYTRVSTSGQAESGIGLAAQRAAIETSGVTVGAWFEDAGKSGASMRNRPALQAALDEVRAGRAGGLVVSKVDRLGRSAGDVLTLAEEAQRSGWRLLVLDVGLDTATPAGELVLSALAMSARFEWRRISERQHEKFAELRRRGRPRGRTAVPRDVADRIVMERDEGSTWQRIADGLNADSVPTARGGKEWRTSTIVSAYRTRRLELSMQTTRCVRKTADV